MPRLKVYRTAIGFHDAYVAAPSQKAALEAWGSDKNLFARGAAEVVDDPALTREPLAHPGKIVRKSRGSLAEQLRALGRMPKPGRTKATAEPGPAPRQARQEPRRRPSPAPSRSALERAEAALDQERAAAEKERAALRLREKALAAERERLEQAQRKRMERLERRLEAARESYHDALARWSARNAD